MGTRASRKGRGVGQLAHRDNRVGALVGRFAHPGAPASVHEQKGASPFQAYVLRPVVEGNRVAARRGGEQQETNDRSVG